MTESLDHEAHQRLLSRRTLIVTAAGAAAVGLMARVATAAPANRAGAGNERGQTAKQGGTAVYLLGQEGSHLVPSFSSLSTVIVPTAPFFNGLTKPDGDLAPIPDLAESWAVSDDGLQYTFTLRQGVTWHDGQPFTAADVKFTWELISHPENTSAAQLYSFFSVLEGANEFHTGTANEITGVKVIDDYTLQATLTTPSAPFLTIGSNQYIVPKHVLGEIAVGDILTSDYARNPIGTGPFVFQAWNTGDSIIAAANENYFDGRPNLDQLVLRFGGDLDGNAIISALKAGEVNAAAVPLEFLDVIKDDPDLRVLQKPGRANQYIEFNLTSQFFNDLNVRKALSFALNRAEISELTWQNRSKIYNSVFPYDWWPTKQDTTMFDNDQTQAAALLDAAGWVAGSDGIREKDGVRFSFTLYAFDQPWWLVVQQQWKALGVEANLEIVDWPTMSTQFYLTHQFDAVALNVPYTLYTDPHYALPGYFLSANNRNSYNNPKSDELILGAAAISDQTERQKLYYEWQEVIAQDVPHLWLGNPDQVYAYTVNLSAPDRVSDYFAFREIRDWAFTE
jgi:peptide/nickel transport system substrate-binding protein